MPNAPKTPHRQVRADDQLWEQFGRAVEQLGTDRSAWLREAMRWCAGERTAKRPRRPADGTH